MKPQLFAIELKEAINNDTFNFLIQFTEQEKQDRIDKLKVRKDKDLSLTGDILAKHCIAKVFGIKFSDIQFKVSEFGKPYIADFPNVHFNISHSGDFVVCAVCDKPIGVDIQRMDDVDFASIAKHVFTVKEQIAFFAVEQDDKKAMFYKTWTAKESYIKFLGTGVRDLRKDIDEKCRVNTYRITTEYTLSVCTNP